MITPGTSVGVAARERRLTSRSWRASSSKLSAGTSTISATERAKAAASALRNGGVDPSTRRNPSITTPALSTSPASPKVRTVIGRTIRITIGQRIALIAAIASVVSSAAPKLGSSMPGIRATAAQKTKATSAQRARARKTVRMP
jgi:hypothetical protein